MRCSAGKNEEAEILERKVVRGVGRSVVVCTDTEFAKSAQEHREPDGVGFPQSRHLRKRLTRLVLRKPIFQQRTVRTLPDQGKGSGRAVQLYFGSRGRRWGRLLWVHQFSFLAREDFFDRGKKRA